jgi:hypothetical protein
MIVFFAENASDRHRQLRFVEWLKQNSNVRQPHWRLSPYCNVSRNEKKRQGPPDKLVGYRPYHFSGNMNVQNSDVERGAVKQPPRFAHGIGWANNVKAKSGEHLLYRYRYQEFVFNQERFGFGMAMNFRHELLALIRL